MPCGYHVNFEDGLVTITGTDRVELEQLVCVGKQLLSDPQFDPTLPHLVDLRGLLITLDAAEVQSLRRFVLQSYRQQVQSSVAIVVNDSLSLRALASLFHLTCAMKKTELFDHYDQALKWLMRREFAQTFTPPGLERS